ncbi:hypothetical protein GCM10028817_18190 [Spirosoma pomorum]
MAMAQDIWQAFLLAHPELIPGQTSFEEINLKMDAFRQTFNQRPLADFDNLSPHQMHTLLHDPWSEQSLVRLQDELSDEMFDQIPFLVLTEMLLEELRTKSSIKLTPKGNLPLALCQLLYERKLLAQDDIERGITKKISEDNVSFLQALKVCLTLSPYVRKRHNTLELTKAGQKAMQQDRVLRLSQLLRDYTMRFNWAYLDDTQTQVGQFGWAYSLYLVHRHGQQWQNTDFYAAKLLTAFPHLGEPIESGRLPGRSLEFERVYRWRFIEQFGLWFGLLTLQKEHGRVYYPDPLLVQKTPLLDHLFQFTA